MAVDNPSYFSLSGGGSVANGQARLERRAASGSTVAGPSVVASGSGPAAGNPRTFAAFFRKRTVCASMGVTNSSSSVVSSSTTSTLTHHDSDRSIASSLATTTTVNEEIFPMLAKQQNLGNVGSSNNNGGRKNFRSLFRSISANTENERTRQILKGDPRPSDVAPPSPYLPHRSHSHSEKDRRQRPMRRRVLKSASELLSNDMIYCGLPGDENNATMERNRRRACGMRNLDDEEEDDDSESAEVFLGIEDARYYNLSALQPSREITETGPRRHSIGTFLGGKEQQQQQQQQQRITLTSGVTNLTSFSINPPRIRVQTEGFIREPDEMAPPIPTIDQVDSPDRRDNTRGNRRCRKHRSGSSKGSRGRTAGTPSKLEPSSNPVTHEDRDDVVFVSSKESEASALWVNYLTACFEQISRQQGRPPFRVRHVTVEDTTSTSSMMNEKIGKARLQIVVVCPGLLERVTTRPEQAANLARQLSPERVLAMMLGVHDGHLNDNHRAALINYSLWRKFFVKDQDETFVGEFLGAAVAILGTTPSPALRNDKTTFSVHPKKVKMGQNRVMVIFNDPLRAEDSTTVIVDRCGEAIEITHVKRRNPYVLQFSIPDRCLEVSMLVGVRVMINGSPQGVKQVKCESRLRELDQILRAHDNPLEFMCQTFGFNPGDREQLDNWMVNAFQKNVPPKFDLLSTPSGSAPLQRNQTSPEEYPTLLHFAARFGLEKLAWQLLECPGGDVACDLRNVAELTPADLADQSSHTRLAHQLRGYMQMNEFTNMYSYLKVISESTANPGAANESVPSMASGNSVCSENEHDKEDYCRPRPLSEAYSIPPAARPITVSTSMNFALPPQLPPPNPTISPNLSEMNYSVLPPPTPVYGPSTTPTPCSLNANGLDLPLQGYLKMHPAGPKTSSPTGGTSTIALTASMTSLRSQLANQSSSASLRRGVEDIATTPNTVVSRINNGAKSRENSGPQDELLEIINDFKNNVFTITEVERLVENWRNRNDVQQSFKDKQRQLTAMRDEYERIQRRIKDEMRAPTPFDRIKKFFTKSKKDSKDSSSQVEDATLTMSKTESANGNLAERRPMSSLSLHSVSSSSSSGRMSIISGCSGTSLGDSGTHSDTDDRRVLRSSREDRPGVTNYEIPPAPKPFAGRYSPMRYTPSPRSSSASNETAEQNRRTIGCSQQPGESDYYIAFPVSGLPIHSFQSNGAPIEPKTPNSPCDNPVYLDLTDKINEIPEVSEKSENFGQLTEARTTLSSPLPPPPPPPPGMCIPFDYVNVTPSKQITNDDKKSSISETPTNDENLISTIRSTNENIDETTTKSIDQNSMILPNDNDEIPSKSCESNNEAAGNSEEYVSTDIIDDNNSTCCDVTESSRLPEYMNIAAPSDQQVTRNVAGLTKKMPAPPVPPRGDSSLGR